MIKQQSGFSLVEVLVVIGIVAILSTVSVSSYVNHKTQNEFELASTELVRHVNLAQQNARLGYQDSDWSLYKNENTVTLFAGDDYDSRDTAKDKDFEVNSRINISGPDTITFQKVSGYPKAVGTYTVGDGERSQVISINEYGTLTIE